MSRTTTGRFHKIAHLETRAGSFGDQILCGFSADGTELIVSPARDRTSGLGRFVLMARGSLALAKESRARSHLPPPTAPYRPGASRVLSASRGGQAQTTIEVAAQRILLRIGVAFVEQVADLPGTPDFYLPDVHVVILTHGCFWHGHACATSRPPYVTSERAGKIMTATDRDVGVIDRLTRLGLRVLVVWECAISGPDAIPETSLTEKIEEFITSMDTFREIAAPADGGSA